LACSVTRRGALRKFGVGLAGFALASFGLPNVARSEERQGTDNSRMMYLEGEILPDHDEKAFRLYPAPQSRNYFLIRKADVQGNYETLQKGIIGSRIHRVPLASGTEVMAVEAERLGISLRSA
jgi:hypothetical protein